MHMTYMYLSDTVFESFVPAYDLRVFVCHCGWKEDQVYPDDGQSRCFYRSSNLTWREGSRVMRTELMM